MKTNKKAIIELTKSVLNENGYKFLKGKCVGDKKVGCFAYKLILSVNEGTFFFLSAKVSLPGINDFIKDILGIEVFDMDYLISITSADAYPSELKNVEREFYGCFYMYLNHPLPANQLEAYGNLLQNYVMPWLEKFKTLSDVTAVFRKNALSGKLWEKVWNNTDLTPNYNGSSLHFPYIIDVVLSKLDPEIEKFDITDLFENTYQQGMLDYCERIQPKIVNERQERVFAEMTNIIKAMPQTIQKLENIDEAKLKAYREKIFG